MSFVYESDFAQNIAMLEETQIEYVHYKPKFGSILQFTKSFEQKLLHTNWLVIQLSQSKYGFSWFIIDGL